LIAAHRVPVHSGRGAGDAVVAEFGRIAGGVPASATRHYPQWWHSDRSLVRAWQAAGYTLGGVEPGRSVTFRRVGSPRAAGEISTSRQRTPAPRSWARPLPGSAGRLLEIDPHCTMLVIQCSGAKQPGGRLAPRSARGCARRRAASTRAGSHIGQPVGRVFSPALPSGTGYRHTAQLPRL